MSHSSCARQRAHSSIFIVSESLFPIRSQRKCTPPKSLLGAQFGSTSRATRVSSYQRFKETGRKKKLKTNRASRSVQIPTGKTCARFACNSTSYTNILHLSPHWFIVDMKYYSCVVVCGMCDAICVIIYVCLCFRKIPTLCYLRREPGESWSRCSGSSEGSGYKASGMTMLTCILFPNIYYL